uniref:TIGR02677 family protein n=1 Tax=Geobacter sp. (strain M21) TaxID=443144 RepID=C6E1B5_GEOSM
MLFNRLPDEIFKPLAGPNRYLFEEVLLFLFKYFSDEDMANEAVFPRRSHVLREIEELLERKGRSLQVFQEEGDADEQLRNAPGLAARYIYNRLVDTGWLEEEEDGYHVNVLMPPHANLLLEALEGVAHAEKKNYGSTIASIRLQLEAIANQPETNARAFLEVVRATRDFTRHLQNIFSGLRGFQELISRQHNPRLALATFFDDFVENLLISDYKSLQAENNPFRHRANVLTLLLHIEHIDACLAALVKVYQEDRNIDAAQARERVIKDLHFIARVFHSVDRRLDAIDLYRMRLESRVAQMVRYLDRNVPDLTNRGVKLLEKLGQTSQQRDDGELPDLPQPARWMNVGLFGQRSVRKPQKRRQPQFIELGEEQELGPEVRERRRLIKEYLQRRVISPAKVAAFVDRQMGEKTVLTAHDFHIETVEDLVAFSYIPLLGRPNAKPTPNLPRFNFRRTGGRIETAYFECGDFIIERKG